MGASLPAPARKAQAGPNEFYGMRRPGDKRRRSRRSIGRSVCVEDVDEEHLERAVVVAAGPGEYAAAYLGFAPDHRLRRHSDGHEADLPGAVLADPSQRAADEGEAAASRVVGCGQLLGHKLLVLAVAVQGHKAPNFRCFSRGRGGNLYADHGPVAVAALLEDTFDVNGGFVLLSAEDDDALGDDLTFSGGGLHPDKGALLERSAPDVDLGGRG